MFRVSRLIAIVAGLLVGAAVGGGGIYLIFTLYGHVADSPMLALLTVVVIGGAPTILGGYLALFLAGKAEKAKRIRNQRTQGKLKFVPRRQRGKKK